MWTMRGPRRRGIGRAADCVHGSVPLKWTFIVATKLSSAKSMDGKTLRCRRS